MAIITGTAGNDRYNDPAYPGNVELKGTHLADRMYGLAGDDELVGFDGDDLLEGGAGADVLWGGGGLDLASYQGSSAGVLVDLGIPSVPQGEERYPDIALVRAILISLVPSLTFWALVTFAIGRLLG